MDIKKIDHGFVLSKDEMAFYFIKQDNNFYFETKPCCTDLETTFSIVNSEDPLESQIFCAFETFVKEMIGNYYLKQYNNIPINGRTCITSMNVNNNGFRIQTGSTSEFLEFRCRNQEYQTIDVDLIAFPEYHANDKDMKMIENKIFLFASSDLLGGYNFCFQNLFNHLDTINMNKETGIKQKKLKI